MLPRRFPINPRGLRLLLHPRTVPPLQEMRDLSPSAFTVSFFGDAYSDERLGVTTSGNSGSFATLQDSGLLTFGDGTNDRPFSIAAWAKSPLNDNSPPLSRNYDSTGNSEYQLNIKTTGEISFACYGSGLVGNSILVSTAAGTMSANTWTHICATYDGSGSASGMSIYINGVAASLTPGGNGTYVAMTSTSCPVDIGARRRGDSPGYGEISVVNLAVFARELSAAEALAFAHWSKWRLA